MTPIKNFENYYAIKDGKVFNLKSQKFIAVSYCEKGYAQVSLYINKKIITKKLHRLIAQTLIPNPNNYKEVNHKNGDKKDYRVENLEWCTRSQNIKHAFDTGLCKRIARRKTMVINIENGVFYESVKEAAKAAGINNYTLANKLCGHRKNNTSFRYA